MNRELYEHCILLNKVPQLVLWWYSTCWAFQDSRHLPLWSGPWGFPTSESFQEQSLAIATVIRHMFRPHMECIFYSDALSWFWNILYIIIYIYCQMECWTEIGHQVQFHVYPTSHRKHMNCISAWQLGEERIATVSSARVKPSNPWMLRDVLSNRNNGSDQTHHI